MSTEKPVMTTPDSQPVVPEKKPEPLPEDPFKDFITKGYSDGKEETAEADDAAGDDEGEEDAGDAGEEDAGDEGEGEGEEAGDDAEEAPDEPKARNEPKRRAKVSAKERIAQLTRTRHAAERAVAAEKARADAAEERLAQLEGRVTKKDLTPAKPEGKDKASSRPNPDDYDLGELDMRFIADVAKFEAKTALAEERAAEKAEMERQRAAEEAEKFETEAMSLMEKGLEKFGDEFDELVIQGAANNKFALSETLGKLVGSSEAGADIVLHLARDPKEALRVYRLSPVEQAAYFGRMEARFSAKGAVKPKNIQAPKAPAPLKTQVRGAGGKFSVSADTSDFAAFEAQVNGKAH